MANGSGFKVPGWAVWPLISLLVSLLGLAGAWTMVKAHVSDEVRHVNAPLIEYRLEQLERHVADIKQILEEMNGES